MLIKYTGSNVRVRNWGKYVWNAQENGHVVEVSDTGDLTQLLSTPVSRLDGSEFVLDDNEPLLQWLTREQAALLALEAVVGDVTQFSKLKSGGIGKVAEVLEVDESVVSDWVAEAKSAPASFQSKPAKKSG
jgi:hypothetical protein